MSRYMSLSLDNACTCIYSKPLCSVSLQVFNASLRVKWRPYSWQAARERDWGSNTPKACTTSGCHPTKPSFKSKLNAFWSCNSWLSRSTESNAVSPGETQPSVNSAFNKPNLLLYLKNINRPSCRMLSGSDLQWELCSSYVCMMINWVTVSIKGTRPRKLCYCKKNYDPAEKIQGQFTLNNVNKMGDYKSAVEFKSGPDTVVGAFWRL